MSEAPDAPLEFMPLKRDTVPEDMQGDEATSPEAPYGVTPTGRIRKRPIGNGKRGPGRASNTDLARRAAGALATLNAVACGGFMVVGLRETASAVAAANEDFEKSAAMALENDPALCRAILRGGEASAKLLLLAA